MNRDVLEFLFVGPLYSIFKSLNAIERKLKNVATQADVDAVTQRLSGVSTQLTTGLGEIQTEIQNLKDQVAAGQPVDLSALSAQVDSVAQTAQQLDDVVPDALPNPEPEPETPAEPEPEPETPTENV